MKRTALRIAERLELLAFLLGNRVVDRGEPRARSCGVRECSEPKRWRAKQRASRHDHRGRDQRSKAPPAWRMELYEETNVSEREANAEPQNSRVDPDPRVAERVSRRIGYRSWSAESGMP